MTELDKLEQYLKEHNYIFTRHADQIEVFADEEAKERGRNNDREWDAICHEDSLGYEEGLLEVLDKHHEYFIPKDYYDDVLGWLTAQDIINLLENKKMFENEKEDN